MVMTLNVQVSYRNGAYKATIGNVAASCTWDETEAVRRAAERYLDGSSLEVLSIDPIDEDDPRGRQIWRVLAG